MESPSSLITQIAQVKLNGSKYNSHETWRKRGMDVGG